ELHDGLEAVQAAAAADARYEPPPGTVRQAKALCKFQEPVSPFAWALETVKLLFDSQLAPLAAGVRSLQEGQRNLLFGIGDTVIAGLGNRPGPFFAITPGSALPAPVLPRLRLQLGGIVAQLGLKAKIQGARGTSVPSALYDQAPVTYFGATVRRGYVSQPASQ